MNGDQYHGFIRKWRREGDGRYVTRDGESRIQGTFNKGNGDG